MFGKKDNGQSPDFELFTLFDSKVGNYRLPMTAINRHDMIRQLSDHMRLPENKNSQLLLNAEDFALFKVGEFTQKTGQLVGINPEHCANLHDIRTAVHQASGPMGIVAT